MTRIQPNALSDWEKSVLCETYEWAAEYAPGGLLPPGGEAVVRTVLEWLAEEHLKTASVPEPEMQFESATVDRAVEKASQLPKLSKLDLLQQCILDQAFGGDTSRSLSGVELQELVTIQFPDQIWAKVLKQMVEAGLIVREGERQTTRWRLAPVEEAGR